jgi:hypothetical protein
MHPQITQISADCSSGAVSPETGLCRFNETYASHETYAFHKAPPARLRSPRTPDSRLRTPEIGFLFSHEDTKTRSPVSWLHAPFLCVLWALPITSHLLPLTYSLLLPPSVMRRRRPPRSQLATVPFSFQSSIANRQSLLSTHYFNAVRAIARDARLPTKRANQTRTTNV